METEEMINAKIFKIIALIQTRHPELSKYLNELPVTIPVEDHPKINIKILKEYYESLEDILKNFTSALPTHPRPDSRRPINGQKLTFDLPIVIERLKQEAEWIEGRHNAITLVKSNKMRIVLIAMHQANEMVMNFFEGPVSLQIIKGKLNISSELEEIILYKDQLISICEKIDNRITAIEETIILLTLVHE